jgi:hypothetical protein
VSFSVDVGASCEARLENYQVHLNDICMGHTRHPKVCYPSDAQFRDNRQLSWLAIGDLVQKLEIANALDRQLQMEES